MVMVEATSGLARLTSASEELRVLWYGIINNSHIVELPSTPRRKGNFKGTPRDIVNNS